MSKNISTAHMVLMVLGGVTIVVLGVLLYLEKQKKKENMSGYGITSALAMYNRDSVCEKGNDMYGGAWSGGCFLPHRVIF